MNPIETIASEDADLLLNSVRNAESASSVVRDSLRKLGEIAGLRIARKWFSTNKEFMTPMSQPVSGVMQEAVNVCVVSTSDEYAVFGAGIASCFRGCLRGQLDLHGRRGAEAAARAGEFLQTPPEEGSRRCGRRGEERLGDRLHRHPTARRRSKGVHAKALDRRHCLLQRAGHSGS